MVGRGSLVGTKMRQLARYSCSCFACLYEAFLKLECWNSWRERGDIKIEDGVEEGKGGKRKRNDRVNEQTND